MKSSSIFPGFTHICQGNKKNLNAIPVFAVAMVLPGAFLRRWEPFPKLNKRFKHRLCSPEPLHGGCRIAVPVVSNSPSAQPTPPSPPPRPRRGRTPPLSTGPQKGFPIAMQSPGVPVKPWRA